MVIIIRDGNVIPRVAKKAPVYLHTLYPTKVDVFMAMGPGVDSAIAITSKISSSVILYSPKTRLHSLIPI